MNKFTHITKLKFNFEAELRGTNPGEIRIYLEKLRIAGYK